MKTVLITGGGGFIGSHLAELLVKKGHVIKVLDDFSSGNINNIRSLLGNRNFKLIRGDIRNKAIVEKAISGVDYVIHLAAQVHVDKSIIDPATTFATNTLGTLNILDASLENDVELVVYGSSSEVYGSAQHVPMNEEHPLNPASPYAASKAAADRMCFAYYNTYRLPIVIARNFNTFGPRQRDSGYAAAIPKFIRRVLAALPPIIYGDGKQMRDYMYVHDAVHAYELILKSYENILGKAINFGSGVEISILDLSRRITNLAGMERKLEPIFTSPRPGEVKRLFSDISLARKLLDFEPKWSVEKGLRDLIEWYRQGHFEEWLAYTGLPGNNQDPKSSQC